MNPPETAEQWWSNVDAIWDELLYILHCFLPTSNYEQINPDETSNQYVIYSDRPMWMVINQARSKRDPILARYLNAAWMSAPDNDSLYSIPRWGEFCDLCSEEYVLYEEEQDVV